MTHLFRSTSIAARCNRVRNHSPQLAHRRLSRLTPWLAVLLLAFAVPEVSWGQTLTTTADNTTTCNSSPYTCCTKFTYTPQPGVTSGWLYIHLYGPVDPTAFTCFNWACLVSQGGTGWTISHTAGTNDIVLNFSGTGGPFTFWLCGNPTCMASYNLFQGIWYDSQNSLPQNVTLNACGSGGGDPCLPCDYVHAWPDGYICVTRGTINASYGKTITVSFNPELPACACPVAGSFDPYWSASSGGGMCHVDPLTGKIDYITFKDVQADDPGLPPCGRFCFQLPPDCVAHETTTITAVTSPGTPSNYSCNGISWTLRSSGEAGVNMGAITPNSSGGQNYPNPLEASTGFKTMVPFETSTSGVAKITIVDQTGKKVFTETMNATYAGKHFFYFTGDKLPTGTYYYTIEFPKGVVIVSKTMLIVK
jgi:hypothetical protein